MIGIGEIGYGQRTEFELNFGKAVQTLQKTGEGAT